MTKEEIAYEQLLQGIQSYIDKKMSEIKKDITVTASISAINDDGTYDINLSGRNYKHIPTLKGSCSVNETVRVLIPQSNYNNMFILKA